MSTMSHGRFARTTALAWVCVLSSAAAMCAAEIKVVTSLTFAAAYLELAHEYERVTQHKLVMESGSSLGTTPDAIPMRFARGETFDVVIMAAAGLDLLIKDGKVRVGSRVDLAQSSIAMAVKAGAPKPDIRTVEALRRTLLAAKSIAHSDRASGVYLSTELFPRLGIASQIAGKTRKIEARPVGEVIANGDFEIGFQQISELRPVKGIDIVGELPPGAQRITIFAAGIPATSQHPAEAKSLIEWLASAAAYPAIEKSGLKPAKSK